MTKQFPVWINSFLKSNYGNIINTANENKAYFLFFFFLVFLKMLNPHSTGTLQQQQSGPYQSQRCPTLSSPWEQGVSAGHNPTSFTLSYWVQRQTINTRQYNRLLFIQDMATQHQIQNLLNNVSLKNMLPYLSAWPLSGVLK